MLSKPINVTYVAGANGDNRVYSIELKTHAYLSFRSAFVPTTGLVLFRLLFHLEAALHSCVVRQFVLCHVRINEHSLLALRVVSERHGTGRKKNMTAKDFSALSEAHSTLWWGNSPEEGICANTHGALPGQAHTSYFWTVCLCARACVCVCLTNFPAGYVITPHGETEE